MPLETFNQITISSVVPMHLKKLDQKSVNSFEFSPVLGPSERCNQINNSCAVAVPSDVYAKL